MQVRTYYCCLKSSIAGAMFRHAWRCPSSDPSITSTHVRCAIASLPPMDSTIMSETGKRGRKAPLPSSSPATPVVPAALQQGRPMRLRWRRRRRGGDHRTTGGDHEGEVPVQEEDHPSPSQLPLRHLQHRLLLRRRHPSRLPSLERKECNPNPTIFFCLPVFIDDMFSDSEFLI